MKQFISILFSVFLFCVAAPMAAANEAPASAEIVNINSADVETLTSLTGVGTVKAEAIVAWRQENGDFVSVDQLVEVAGIGEATVEANKDLLTIK